MTESAAWLAIGIGEVLALLVFGIIGKAVYRMRRRDRA